MSDPSDPSDQLAQSVEFLLERLFAEAEAVAGDRPQDFAFNVLLNALFSVLEVIRENDPELHGTYLQMSVLMLQDD